MKIVISGSFRKHYSDIVAATRLFELRGFQVLSPKSSRILNPGEAFALLESDESTDPFSIEAKHLRAIELAEILYIVCPEGYIGVSAALEIGWATAHKKRIICSESPFDALLQTFCGSSLSPNEVADMLVEKRNEP